MKIEDLPLCPFNFLPLQEGRGVAKLDREDYIQFGTKKWSLGNKGYVSRTERLGPPGQRRIFLHRAIMGYPDGMEIDHKDGNRLNNQKSNLRICSRSENGRNTRKRSDNTSGFKGVSFRNGRNKWKAQCMVDGKLVINKDFDTLEDAAAFYRQEARKLHGVFFNEG